jgi:hypothetical protein
MANTLEILEIESIMTKLTPRGKVNLRLWSGETPLREPAKDTGLTPKYVHDKGAPVKLANGKIRASKAARHYLSFEDSDVNRPDEANLRIREILDALRGTELARLIASGAVEAEIDLAAFHGDVDWEAQLDPQLVAAARAANIRMIVEHYDKFTDEGAPLAVRL